MGQLANRDLRTLLASVATLHSDACQSSLPSRLFRAVSNAVSCEIVAIDGWRESGHFTGKMWYEPDQWLTPELGEAFGAYADDHPLVVPIFVERRPGALKISDFLTTQQFHRTGIYNEFYKVIGIDEQFCIGLEISRDFMISCTLNRGRRNFTERDRKMLNLLGPHIAGAIRNAETIDMLEREREYLNEVATRGIVVLDRKGKVQFVNGLAHQLIKKYFPDYRADKLPDVLRGYVNMHTSQARNNEYFKPAVPFCIADERSDLQVRLVFDLDRDAMKLILEETDNFRPEDLIKLGLTKRESEVLFWIAMGKTDEVIAAICGTSTRTVQKHVEHIRQKFNVETRTGAVRCALDLLNDLNTSAQIEL